MKRKHNSHGALSAKRSAMIAAAVLAALLWILFDIWIQPFSGAAYTVEIPNFCGLSASDVQAEEWMQLRTEYRHDAEAAEGTVLSQAPSAGSRRKISAQNPACELTLVISLGTEHVVVPRVIGEDVRTLLPRLREQGFVVKTEMQTSPYPVGRVLSCTHEAGESVPRGTELFLTVSAGEPVQTVSVPDLKGLSRSDALIRLWLCQLAVGEVVEVSSDAESGHVVGQSHAPGTVVMAGTKIKLYISAQEPNEKE